MFFAVYGLSIAMMPAFIFAFPAAYLYQRGLKAFAYPFILLGVLYNTAVITVWCGWTLVFFLERADANALIPATLWSYGAAIGPLAYMTAKEGQGGGDNTSAVFTTYFAQVGFVAMALTLWFGGVTVLNAMAVFAAVMLLGTLLEFIVEVQKRNASTVAERMMV